MYRTLPYLALFAATVLLQVFLFDNLSISVYLNPLVYIAFIVLLPLDTPPVVLLGAGLALGVTMDGAMGAAGINTLFCDRENLREGGVPSPERLGRRVFTDYLLLLTLLHHAVFFVLETLSWSHALHTLARIAVSSAVTALFVWIIARIFTVKFPVRV